MGRTIGEQYGHFFFNAVDCQGNAAAKVVVQASAITVDTFNYYVDTFGTPSLTRTSTSETGRGGYINLPAGPSDFTLLRDTGGIIGPQHIVIRPGSITYMHFTPTP